MIRAVISLIRIKHWTKNFFVLFPLMFSISFLVPDLALSSALATAAFCLASSFCYVLNDIVDRDKDRLHPVKKKRPLASGALSVPAAIVIGIVLLAATLAISLFVHYYVLIAVALYVMLNLAYSFFLKHVVLIDVMCIAFGFVLRVVAGGFAIGVELTPWLLFATLFLSLFMGFGKRRHDLLVLEKNNSHRPVLEHYSLQLLDSLIIVSVALIIITYTLYTTASETVNRFKTTGFIYTVPFVVFGVFRYLYLVYKKDGGGDPADLVLRDATLIVTVCLWLAASIGILLASHFGVMGT